MKRPPPPALSSRAMKVHGAAALVSLGIVLAALPTGSRLGASARAGGYAAWRGRGAMQVLKAVLQPREFGAGGRWDTAGDSTENWSGVEDNVLSAPAVGEAPHRAALQRAEESGWLTCGSARGQCALKWDEERHELSDGLAAEAVVLKDPHGVRVKAAMQAAQAAGLSNVDRSAVHGPFLTTPDRDRLPLVERVLGLTTLWSMGWPLPQGTRITSPFGSRVHPVLGRLVEHKGVDLAAAEGTPLTAPADGEVVHVGQDSVSGRYVVLDHGYGVQSVSCHLSTARVKRGDQVAQGKVYANSGSTGRVTGAHLHYGIRVAGRFVDPVAVASGQTPAGVGPPVPAAEPTVATPRPAPASPKKKPTVAPRRRHKPAVTKPAPLPAPTPEPTTAPPPQDAVGTQDAGAP